MDPEELFNVFEDKDAVIQETDELEQLRAENKKLRERLNFMIYGYREDNVHKEALCHIIWQNISWYAYRHSFS